MTEEHRKRTCCRIAVCAGALLLSFDAAAQASYSLPKDIQVRTSSYTYFPDGRLKTETLEPDGAAGVSVTTEVKWPTSIRKQVLVTGWNGSATESRTTTTDFSSDRRFPVLETNALSQTTNREFDARFAQITALSDANGVTTRTEYDALGRKLFERRGYASSSATAYTDYTRWTYDNCTSGCASVEGVLPAMKVTTAVYSSPNGNGVSSKLAPTQTVYLDKLGRELRTETEALKGGVLTAIYKDSVYDARGNVFKQSLPYFMGETAAFAVYDYDALGRKTQETGPDGLVTTYTYAGLKTTITVKATEGNRVREVYKDGVGLLSETVDPNANHAYFVHDAFGNRTHSIDAYGNAVVASYDIRGRRTGLADPDMGALSYTPNAFGENSSDKDGKGRTTVYAYDLLGRLKTSSRVDLITAYTYDGASNGKGKLNTVSSDNGYCRTHTYDTLGRPQSTTVKMGGVSPCTAPTEASLTTSQTYDAAGRPDTLTYPTGLVVQNAYNTTLGFLDEVHNQTGGAKGTSFWQWQESDALGRTTKFLSGKVQTLKTYDPNTTWLNQIMAGSASNAALADVQESDYMYTSVGDLLQRSDRFNLPGMIERTVHDALGRLKSYARYTDLSGNNEVPGSKVSITYDALGNIKTKSDTGTYYYNTSGAGSVRPHAVAEMRGALNASYAYEAETGNLLKGAGRSYEYTAAGLLSQVGDGDSCHRFYSQGEGLRYQQLIYGVSCTGANGAGPISKTLYLHPDAANGLLFERESRGASTYYKHYISAGGAVVALLVSNTGNITNNTTGTVSYLHYDHLGSVVALSNVSGAVVERRSFDPWGRPRAVDGTATNGELPGGLAAVTDRGFTLHEHLEGLRLVHMNGRVYDPATGRFASPDPLVSRPDDMQSYNRYAYVSNRPLISTDPTGYADEGAPSWWQPIVGAWSSSNGQVASVFGFRFSFGGSSSATVASGNPNGLAESGRYNPSATTSAMTEPANVTNPGGDSARISAGDVRGGGGAKGAKEAGIAADLAVQRYQQCGGNSACIVAARREMLGVQQEMRAMGLPLQERLGLNANISQASVLLGEYGAALDATGAVGIVALSNQAGSGPAAKRTTWGLSISETKAALSTAQEAYKGSTVVGHSLSKHTGRNPETWGTMTGSMKTWNEQGMAQLRDVVRGPGQFTKQSYDNGLTFLEKRLPDGRGVRLNMDGSFKGFLD